MSSGPPPPSDTSPASEGTTPSSSLKDLAVRGGGYLIGREAIGGGVRLIGLILVVRLVGPANYGIYNGAAAFVLFVVILAQMGIEVYLIRQPLDLEPAQINNAYTFLLCTSFATTALAEALTFAIGPLLRPTGVLLPLRVLLLSIPVNVLWAPAQAAIERRFRYRAMGLIELGGDVVLYATAVPLAFLKAGVWSLVAGYFAWQTWLLVASLVASGLRPRLSWSRTEMRELTRHGISFASARGIAQAFYLVNPMVVGSIAGAAGVGYVAFAQRLVDTLAFAQRGANRLGMVTMSKVPDDHTGRLRYSIEEGGKLVLLTLALPFAAFGVVARVVVPVLFGHQWDRAIPVFCVLAVATVLNASQIIQTAFLYSRGRNGAMVWTVVVKLVLMVAVAVPLVHWMGLVGYGVACLISILCVVCTDRAVRRLVPFSYRALIPWLVILVPPVLMPLAPMPWALLLLLPLALLATPPMRAEMGRVHELIASALPRRRRPAPPTVREAT